MAVDRGGTHDRRAWESPTHGILAERLGAHEFTFRVDVCHQVRHLNETGHTVGGSNLGNAAGAVDMHFVHREVLCVVATTNKVEHGV